MFTLTTEPQRLQENMILVGKGLNDRVEKLICHVVLVHFLSFEEVLVVHNEQTCNFLQHLVCKVIPSVLFQVPLHSKQI